jgi:cyclophilin family peptidyl-prolyl cis-trans isomerase
MKRIFLLLSCLCFLSLQGQDKETKKTLKKLDIKEGLFATIITNKGTIVLSLAYEKAPITVANFVTLAEGKNTFVKNEKLKGKPFYNGLIFHRVIPNFMIQSGDPLANGSGTAGYSFKDEISDLKHSKAGILSMANSGPNSNSSQFFITHKETPWLDGIHTVFGEVVSGMEIVNKIAQNDTIKSVVITRKGKLAKRFDAVKTFSDYMNQKIVEEAKQAQILAEKKLKLLKIQTDKTKFFDSQKLQATKTASGLEYVMLSKGEGQKPVLGSTIYIYYAGYFEDGNLFDSNYEAIVKNYLQYNPAKALAGEYKPFPFVYGDKKGLIAGFLEGVNLMSFGDKMLLFIPSNLAYGQKGAGGIIKPNTNLIFELELVEKLP